MGGNLELLGGHRAQNIDLKVHNRNYILPILNNLLQSINDAYAKQYHSPLWSSSLLQSKEFLSGSSLHFFNTSIPDNEFVIKKPKIGDIDTQINKEDEANVEEFLTSAQDKIIGDAKLLGFQRGNEQFSSLWEFKNPPIKIQIDLEFVKYDQGVPTNWSQFSHSSSWEDLTLGIKGVFHKYLMRALTASAPTEKYVARQLKKGIKIADTPVTDNNVSFAVSSKQGGGMRQKYIPYTDPTTGKEMKIDGIPVMLEIPSTTSEYIQDLDAMFNLLFNRAPSPADKKLMWSFVGGLKLANKYLDQDSLNNVAAAFITNLYGKGAQGLYKNDPLRDKSEKQVALDTMLNVLNLTDAASIKSQAAQAAAEYYSAYKLTESTEIKPQLRKGIPHLHNLKPGDLLDLLDEIHDGNGNFKLENIPLNVKIDGFGGRFGKSSDGRPFMGTSRSEPKYQAGFVKYHQEKGTQDPATLHRAKLFDQLFDRMINVVDQVDQKLGSNFLLNKQVSCEVLFLPFATQQPNGKIKFVGISYDQLPEGIELALVPINIVNATTGEELPNSKQLINKLVKLGRLKNTMFIDNSLVQKEGLDVTAIVPPLENLEVLKSMLSSNKLSAKREVKAALAPVALALEAAIIDDPNIVGKYVLGKNYEGIVLNTRKGPVKVTTKEQQEVISTKQSTRNSRTNKIAVVTAGSFVGHRGHEQLVNFVLNKAAQLNADPYVYISSAVGVDDPITPELKLETWHKLYPNHKDMFQIIMPGGSPIKKIEKELVTVSNPPPYDNIIMMVGEDRYEGFKKWFSTLSKRMKNPKYPGFEHVTFDVENTPRSAESGGTGVSFTQLRNILKDPAASEKQQLDLWVMGFNEKKLGREWIKHLMDVSRKNMGIEKKLTTARSQIPERLSTALIRPRSRITDTVELSEGPSIDSTLRAINNDIGEPVLQLYGTLKYMAKNFVDNKGDLKGFSLVAAGTGKQWYNTFYFNKLGKELHHLTQQAPRYSSNLHNFLGTMPNNFNALSENLPEILLDLGQRMGNKELVNKSKSWIRTRDNYKQFLADLENSVDDGDQVDSTEKAPKDRTIGQQTSQADSIVADILRKLPSKIAGDIRNAIARSPNKLKALQAELQKRNVTVPMSERRLKELSTNKLAQYKTAAAAQASAADKSGDFKKGDKRFSGIVKATKKQFSNDNKSIAKEDICVPLNEDIENIMAYLVNSLINNEAI
jgi:hypothetical protein